MNVRFYVSMALKFEYGVSIYWKICCQNLRSYVIGYDVPMSRTTCCQNVRYSVSGRRELGAFCTKLGGF